MRIFFRHGRKFIMLTLAVAMLAIVSVAAFAGGRHHGGDDNVDLWLTILHNNDGESDLISAGAGELEDFGGVARFAAVVRKLRLEAIGGYDSISRNGFHCPRNATIMLSSGDNYLAGPEFNASLQKGVPFYDSIAMDLIGYDALCIGNHEFDFGPDVLADFIEGFRGRDERFLSANLDVSNEPRLKHLAQRGRFARSTVIQTPAGRVGVVGATTEKLAYISSPRNVVVNDVLPAVQAEVARLTHQGVDKIILISHLQSVEEDLALAPMLHDVDVMIAGGGDELLANDGDLLIPGDESIVHGSYPLWVSDADGNQVPVVTTSGGYRYVGRLVVGFDRRGKLVQIDAENSGPVRVAGGSYPDAVQPVFLEQKFVVDPVSEAVEALKTNVVAQSDVVLDGRRSQVRAFESNEGNLIADALLWQASQLAGSFGAPVPDVALQNGGGIRNDSEIPAGNLTEFDTFSILPFLNFTSIVPGISRGQFKEILENAVSRVEFGDGRFAQIAGFKYEWDPAGTAQLLDADGNVTQTGTRVRHVELDNGTVVVDNGAVVPGAALNVATIDFLARSGDQYPFRGAAFVTVGVTYQQALENYLVDGLGGEVLAADYPLGGEGRITRTGSALVADRLLTADTPVRFHHELEQNYPNPFNPQTTIAFTLPDAASYRVAVYNAAGQEVWSQDGAGNAGRNTITWNGFASNGAPAATGVYFYSLTSGTFKATRKMTMLK